MALVPGFLGFEHDGALTYFADRFIAGVRAGLAARNHLRIPVVPVPTLPVGSLASRQRDLLAHLARLDDKLGGARAWHLVGHSTGGLDAAMLLRTDALADAKGGTTFGGRLDTGKLTIASAVTIAAPHHGTGLARELASRFSKLGHGLRLLVDVFGSVRGDLAPRLRFFAASARTSALDFMFHDALATDLLPTVASALTRAANRTGRPLFSIATCAPAPAADSVDPMFRDLYTWTSNHDDPPPPDVPHRDATWVTAIGPLALDATTNDGVVTTLRQLDGRVVAFAAADHADVIGRYRRTSLLDGTLFDGGLLTSGANFDDDQFFDLIDVVASCLDGAIHAT